MTENKATTDEGVWKIALQSSFVYPPRQWSFGHNTVYFGNNLYTVKEATLYELALLDIHAQYWEATNPGPLRRYHRGLQYEVEDCFQSNQDEEISTPSILRLWLIRTIFQKSHDQGGRNKMEKILNDPDISADFKEKFETGNFNANGIVSTFIYPKDVLLRALP
jgi:hypothetical protein